MSEKDISVCTLYSGRKEHLINLISGLRYQKLVPKELIISVMDNDDIPKVPDTQFHIEWVHSFSDNSSLPLASARNTAAQKVSTDYIVFLDVDCIPHPLSLETFFDTLDEYSCLLSGTVKYLKEGWNKEWTFDSLHSDSQYHSLQPRIEQGSKKLLSYELFWSLCFGISKDNFYKIGGFDAQFLGYGGEDTDFAFMARDNQIPHVKLGGTSAYHQYHDSEDPPISHFDSIITNSILFRRKWGMFPMKKWLDNFESMGLITVKDDTIEVLRKPLSTMR